MLSPNFLKYIILSVPGILLGITVHEFSHGYVAYKLGDSTPLLAGRLSLNPFKHLDLLGTLMLFIFRFGWAKPVPINPYNFKNPRQGVIYVSLAGPLSNIAVAGIFGIFTRLLTIFLKESWATPLIVIFIFVVMYNILLGLFNLIPIPPLDGSKILFAFTGESRVTHFLHRYGFLILIILLVSGSFTGINLIWILIGPFFKLFSILFLGYDISSFM